MTRSVLPFLAVLMIAGSASATDPDILLNGGTMDFAYHQVPSGPVTGLFASSGSLVDDPATEGTVATTFELDGQHYLAVVGALEDTGSFVDGGILVVNSPVPVAPGTYALDGLEGLLVFVDDAAGWVPPTDLWNTNWTLELASMTAAGKYASIAGLVTVDEVSESRISGTFEATVFDASSGITLLVTAGEFNVEVPVSTDPSSWSAVKGLYR